MAKQEQFTSFQDMAAYLKGQLSTPLAAIEGDRMRHIGAEPERSKRMREALERSKGCFEVKDFPGSDDAAWKALRVVGLSTKNDVTTPIPEKQLQTMDAQERKLASTALTVIGTSLRFHNQHLFAVQVLENAAQLDDTNIFGLRNLSDLCVAASPRTLSRDTSEPAQEINRETEVGIRATNQLVSVLESTPGDTKNMTWALNNLAGLEYRRGRYLIHNLRQQSEGGVHMQRARDAATKALKTLGLTTSANEILTQNLPDLGAESTTAARSLSIIGSTYEMLGDREKARQNYSAALKIKPDFREAQDKTQRLGPPKIQPKPSPPPKTEVKPPKPRETPAETKKSIQPARAWAEILSGEKPARESQTIRVSLTNTDPAKAAEQAAALATELKVIRGVQDGPQSFVEMADGRQDKWWAGLDGQNLPEFVKTQAILTTIAGDAECFGRDQASHAKKVGAQYRQIRESMTPPELENDLTQLQSEYQRIAQTKA